MLAALAGGAWAVREVALQWGTWAAACAAGAALGLLASGPWLRRARRWGADASVAALRVDASGRGRLLDPALATEALPVTLVSLRMTGRIALLGLAIRSGGEPSAADARRACMHYLTGIAANDARTWHRLSVWATWSRRGEPARRA